MILDVAITGVDGQSRTGDDFSDRTLQVRYDEKTAKYGRIAEENTFQFILAVVSHTDQTHSVLKRHINEQTRQ